MNNDPCPSCDGDQYDEAAGECSECGFVLGNAPWPDSYFGQDDLESEE